MKRSNVVVGVFGFVFLFISCAKKPDLSELPTKTENGFTQILISTPATSKNQIEFDSSKQEFVETNQPNFLNNLAHMGYIAGKENLHQAIVLGDAAQMGSLVAALPIGMIRFGKEEDSKNWLIFADKDRAICDFEDLIHNHFTLKNQLQLALSQLSTNVQPISWLDETYLELKVNETLL